MNIARASFLAFAVGTGVAAGCSHTTSPPPPTQDNGLDGGGSSSSSSGGTNDGGGAGGATDGGGVGGATDGGGTRGATDSGAAGGGTDGGDAGGGTEGGAAGGGTDGGAGGDATGMGGAAEGGGADAGREDAGGPSGPPLPGPVCSQTAIWGAGTELAISSSSLDNSLGAITPDELTIAWTIGTGSSAMIAYADRAAETDAFGTPQTLSAASFADDRVAISADGLRLVVVNGDRQGFSEMTRTARMGTGNTFGAPSVGSYSNFAGTLATTTQAFGDPVLSADDEAFYYSLYGRPGQLNTVARSTRLLPSDAWPVGALLPTSSVLEEEQEEVLLRRRPTAISSDDQTLFYWDEVSGTERATWLDTSTGVFTGFVDLGARQGANPNTACNRLYYSDAPAGASSDGSATLDLFVASD